MRPRNKIKSSLRPSADLRSHRRLRAGFFRLFFAFAASFIFHGIPFVAVRHLPQRRILRAQPMPVPIDMLEIPLAPRPRLSDPKTGSVGVAHRAFNHGNDRLNDRHGRSKSAQANKIPLNQLFVQRGDLTTRPSSGADHSAEMVESNQPSDDSSTAAWGSGAFEFKRVEDYGLMHRIFERTNDALFYPSVLAAHQISGTVTSRLVFTATGECDWNQTSIQSSQSYLRVYILSVLKGVCRQNYSQFLRGRKKIVIDFFFEFSLTEHDDKDIASDRLKVMGNVLAFFRNSQHSIGEWHLGPFKGMFPVPMVAVDFGWLTENWDNVMNHKDALNEADKEFAD